MRPPTPLFYTPINKIREVSLKKKHFDGLSPTYLKPPPRPPPNVDYVFFLTIVLSFFSNI